jgi:nitrate reductase NapE component
METKVIAAIGKIAAVVGCAASLTLAYIAIIQFNILAVFFIAAASFNVWLFCECDVNDRLASKVVR